MPAYPSADAAVRDSTEPRRGEFGADSENRISLDGEWDFLHLVEDYRARPVEWRQIAVPGPWQAQFPDLRMRGGTGIYRRGFDIPAGWLRARQFIRFGAVFHIARIWVNDSYLGMHIGGFLPFAFDATELLIQGRNEIRVQVDSPVDDPNEFPDTPFAEIPFGKQSWYGPLSGIWQSVSLERRVADHIARLRLAPEWETGELAVHAYIAEASVRDGWMRAAILAPGGETVVSTEKYVVRGSDTVALSLFVPDRLAWSPAAPHLYSVTITLEQEGHPVDQIVEHFGFRRIETRNGRFFLNGEPLLLRAALDQDYYPDTICTTPSTEFLEDQFRRPGNLASTACAATSRRRTRAITTWRIRWGC